MRRLLVLFLVIVASASAGCATGRVQGAAGFQVQSNVPDAAVWVDDVLIGRVSEWSSSGRFIKPGFHRVEIRHPAYYSHFREIEVAEGSGVLIKAELRPLLD